MPKPLTAPLGALGMTKAVRCDYAHTYSDVRTGVSRDYQCTRPLHNGGQRCIFHSDAVDTDHDEIRRAFLAELQSELGSGKKDPLLFIGCKLPFIALDNIRTDRTMCFADARFLGDVELIDVSCGAADFTDAVFAGQLRMAATAADMLSLRKVRFEARRSKLPIVSGAGTAVDVNRCKFGSFDMALASATSAHLEDCEIGGANFRGSSIDDLLIQECEISGAADLASHDLGHAQFKAVAFGGAVELEGTVFRQAGRFVRVQFRRQELVRFGRALSNVSLINTDVTRIRFSADAVWNDDGDPYAVLDEREMGKGRQAPSPSEVLAVYRNLRECHEYWLMYREAGWFYIKEMDLQRRYKTGAGGGGAKRGRAGRYVSLTNGYNVLCRYGESLRRASAWVAGVFTASAAYYFLAPDPEMSCIQNGCSSQIAAALERTLAAFFHVGKGGVEDYMVRIASLPTLGSMFIVLKRRLERKLRH